MKLWSSKVVELFVSRFLLTFLIFFIPIHLNGKVPFPQFHEATYKLGWDINFSPYAGGEDVLFAHRCVERLEGYLISFSPVSYSKEPQARFWRLSELFLGWLPVNYLAVVAQHEVFGHGYRIRDINHGKCAVKGYGFEAPPPYGPGGGFTAYKIGDEFTTTDDSLLSMAGVESTAILAILTKLKWLEANFIDPRQVCLYLFSQQDLNLYIGTLKEMGDEDGHDISNYIKSLNYTYTSNFISKGRLRSLSWINLGDPFTYYSIYAWFHYVTSGKETKIRMIPIGKTGYLPNVRLGLSPFGPEFFIENFLLQGNRPIYFYLKGGDHSQNRYGGIGFYAEKIFHLKNWFAGLRFDAWIQPKLLLKPGSIPFADIDLNQKPSKSNPIYPYSEQKAKQIGAAGSVVISYQTKGKSGFELELGAKSKGFLPGYSLLASPTVRLFYSLIF